MRWLRFVVALVLAWPARGDLVSDIRFAIASGNLDAAKRRLAETAKPGFASVEWIEASSWLARGLLDAGSLEEADKYAMKTRTAALAQLSHRKLDSDGALPLALGAAIEVHAQVLFRRGERSEAVSFLRTEVSRWRGTSMEARITKNLNLLSLDGKPAPPIDVTRWVGPMKPKPLSELRGHPVLLFFWAHWCADCKAEAPIIQQLMSKYRPAGLKFVGPTMHYGFAGGGEEASPDRETQWIEQTRQQYYGTLSSMTVPVSENALRTYGVSTTPTLVLVDKHGSVRLFHPGVMSYAELEPLVSKAVSE